jgi:surface protein
MSFNLVYNFAVGTAPTFPVTIKLPIVGGSGLSVDWGDGNTDALTTHAYASTGIYTVQITWTADPLTSTFDFMSIGGANNGFITSCTSFGTTGLANAQGMFAFCSNLTSVPATLPASFTNIASMFFNASVFNQNISGWNTINVTSMENVFFSATLFNQDISAWNVSNVTNMTGTFGNGSFNQDISAWNVSNVIIMQSMFATCPFNKPLDSWNVSNVTNLSVMFQNNSAFNQSLSSWNTASVIYMNNMFNNSTSFNQNLGGWDIGQVTAMDGMLDGTSLSRTNYNSTLTGWAAQTVQPNVSLGATGLTYSAQSARDTLTDAPNSWIITGDTFDPTPEPIVCYLKGSLILTKRGFVPIENIKAGDKVVTKGNIYNNKFIKEDTNLSIQPVMWVSKFKVIDLNSKSRPICIKTDALGKNYPFRDLYVSPNHSLILNGKMVPAKNMVNGKTIVQDKECDNVEYYHLECESHSAIIANGVLSESYLEVNNRDVFENSIRLRPTKNFKTINYLK